MPAQDPISYDDVARQPLPGMAYPVGAGFGAGERVLTYLYSPEGTLERRLFAVPLHRERRAPLESAEVPLPAAEASGGSSFSLDEQLRRERARELGLGVTSAVWAKEEDALLVPLAGDVYVASGLASDPTRPAWTRAVAGPASAPELSPDGSMVAYALDGDLYVADARGRGSEIALTTSAEAGLSNGVAEFVAQEEMGRSAGFWWSGDSRWLAFTEVDERHIPVYRIVHQGSEETGPGTWEDHRYPFAGGPNALVRLGVVPAGGGETLWLDSFGPDGYLARVHWLEDGRLLAEVLDREQVTLQVVCYSPATGARALLHRESCRPYVTLHDDFRELPGGQWLWSSERSGFRHLEVRDGDGGLVRTLTSGNWQVDRVEAVDRQRELVYYCATAESPTERHLYCVALGGGRPRRVTSERGTHFTVVGERCGLYVDRFSSLAEPPVVTLRDAASSSVLATLHRRRDPRIDELRLEPPELVSFPAEDGTTLYGLVYRPDGAAGEQAPGSGTPGAVGRPTPGGAGGGEASPSTRAAKPAPTAVYLYGGPHLQLVLDDWAPTVSMRAQALRRLGCAVIVTDNRGSARRGLDFERPIVGSLGDVEVRDQLRGLERAVAEGITDPSRVAVYGWSYGGYMALMCLARSEGRFRAAVAGAPVTAWDGYDTCYTERYLGSPSKNPEGYASSSVLSHVPELRGDLLLVHGLIDENVHFRHSARLLRRLAEEGRDYDLLCFPEERHLPRRQEDRAYMEQRVIRWLAGKLGLPVGA